MYWPTDSYASLASVSIVTNAYHYFIISIYHTRAEGHFVCTCSAESILMRVTAGMRLLCVYANLRKSQNSKQIFRRWK